MQAQAVFFPMLALVALTCLVWLRMYAVRIPEMRRLRIHPQAVATSAQKAARFVDTRAADNFNNLFEVPVLFYLASLVAFLTQQVTPLFLGLAWTFVAARWVHSAIQCSTNKVMHRFAAYSFSTCVLWVAWAVLGWGLLHA